MNRVIPVIFFMLIQSSGYSQTIRQTIERILDTPGTRFITNMAQLGRSTNPSRLFREGNNRLNLSFNNISVYVFHPYDENATLDNEELKNYIIDSIVANTRIDANESEERIINRLDRLIQDIRDGDGPREGENEIVISLVALGSIRTEPAIREKVGAALAALTSPEECTYNDRTLALASGLGIDGGDLHHDYDSDSLRLLYASYDSFLGCMRTTQLHEINHNPGNSNNEFDQLYDHCKKENNLPDSCVKDSVRALIYHEREGKNIQCINDPSQLSNLTENDIAFFRGNSFLRNSMLHQLRLPDNISADQVFSNVRCQCSGEAYGETCCENYETYTNCDQDFAVVNSLGWGNTIMNWGRDNSHIFDTQRSIDRIIPAAAEQQGVNGVIAQ